jgi:hypothetical protein
VTNNSFILCHTFITLHASIYIYTVNDFISKQHISEITHSTSELYRVLCLILMLVVYSYNNLILTIVPPMMFFNDRGRGDTNIDIIKYT